MKFAACYEDRSVEYMVKQGKLRRNQVADHLADNLQWMQAHWFIQPQYFRFHFRPLLLNFGPMFIRDAKVWQSALAAVRDRPAFYALQYLWKGVGADGGFTWVYPNAWDGSPDAATVRNRLRATFGSISANPDQVIISAFPGFRDVYQQHYPVIDHRNGETMRQTLQVGMKGPWPIIQLVTWNDYGEGTMIEPTHEFGYVFLEIIQQARREESGGTFLFTAEDLRLPASLYAQRKKRIASVSALDRISRLLSEGACKEARRLLDSLQ